MNFSQLPANIKDFISISDINYTFSQLEGKSYGFLSFFFFKVSFLALQCVSFIKDS